ncbi:uncharacterized protein Pyn_28876 [Prunus yedoensis var. nudiflora]|uniref:Homologous recombination OB-fold protein OB-fold domain-containing protein n=1 Tax=Prunus yedoensis var. nudiflora TaxID=2094558 RepID=A0A314ZAH9_PRUYE|nr:uncharacterized protein Pyn_28876 [Prunus yedoensis var. nudiflora]
MKSLDVLLVNTSTNQSSSLLGFVLASALPPIPSNQIIFSPPSPLPTSFRAPPEPYRPRCSAGPNHHPPDRDEEEPIPTQEFVRRVVEVGDDHDADFTANPWLCALDFLTKQGAHFPTPLGSIRKGIESHRLAQVVAIIKSCTPNGLGDLMLTLKDPTGTIGASIHHTVLSEGDFGKSISVGSVLVLQKVAVFFPSRSSCYLNITKNNMVKVISKDSGPLMTKDLLTSSVHNPAPSSGSSENLCMPQEKFPPSQESTERIMNFLRQNSKARESQHNTEKHMETDHAATGLSCSGHEQCGSQNMDVEVLSSLVKKAMPDGIANMEDTIDNDQVTLVAEKPNAGRVATETMHPASPKPLIMTQPISASANSVEIPNPDDDQEVGRITGAKRQRQPLISRTSLPEYTEEELDLFEFD